MLLYWVYLLYLLGGSSEPWPSLTEYQGTYYVWWSRVHPKGWVLMPTFCFWSSRAGSLEIPVEYYFVKFWPCLGIFKCDYREMFSPAPSYHCSSCTLIRGTVARDPPMNRCVPRTKVIEILILIYPHFLEYGLCHLLARRLDLLFRSSSASTPSSSSTESKKSKKSQRCWRQSSRYIFFFAFAAS